MKFNCCKHPLLAWGSRLFLLLISGSRLVASAQHRPWNAISKLPAEVPPADSPLLDSLLRTTPALHRVATNPAYELQVIYTRIDRDAQNQPRFTTHTYHVDSRRYFNPASLVKLPVAALTLEKLRALSVSPAAIMATGKAYRCQTAVPFAAPADPDRRATPANYIKRMLLVSDNSAYNRLYEFLGQRPLNERLAQLGYPNARITRRFAPCDTTANRHTNPITLLTPQRDTLYEQSAQVNAEPYRSPLGRISKGHAYRRGGQLIRHPYDFTTANHLPLLAATDLLRRLLFPESVSAAQRLSLAPTDYALLRASLHATPHGSGFHPYQQPAYFDAYKKYLYYGRSPQAAADSTLRIYNVVGMSHGFLSDVAYFADQAHQSEFMLSAVLYVNADGILNDGAYEYESIGFPFLAALGKQIRRYEAQRPRLFRPDLAEFFHSSAN